MRHRTPWRRRPSTVRRRSTLHRRDRGWAGRPPPWVRSLYGWPPKSPNFLGCRSFRGVTGFGSAPEPPFGPWVGVLPDVFDLAVLIETGAAEFATVAGALHPAPFGLRHVRVVIVDPDGSVSQPVRNALSLACVLGPDRARQPVVGVVGDPHRVVFIGERLDGEHRAERLIPCHRHARVAAVKNGWWIEEAVAQACVVRSAAAAAQYRAFGQACGDVGLDFV